MSRIQFSESAWEEYLYWQTQDKRTLKKINNLLKEIDRTGSTRIGKAELHKGDLSGSVRARIDGVDRLVYRVEDGVIKIEQCRGHYED